MLIHDIAEAHPDIATDLRTMDPVQAAATFGGLMLLPELQANHLRLEALVHLSVFDGRGRGMPDQSFLQRSFERLGQGWAGLMEDPSEQVFTFVVHTDRGNFRIREGIYEGAAFHLQRMLEIVARMPAATIFRGLRTAIEALLKISDAAIAREGLPDYRLGEELPQAQLPTHILGCLSSLRKRVFFANKDLSDLGIDRDDLTVFAFNLEASSELGGENIFHTSLQRRPILVREEGVWLLLPSAITAAIPRCIAEFSAENHFEEAFSSALVDEYARLFRESPLLGQGPDAPIYFQRIEGGAISAVMKEVDRGRFLHLIFFVEEPAGFLTAGFSSTSKLSKSADYAIQFHLSKAVQNASGTADFKEGLTLVVLCGVGGRIALQPPEIPNDNWTIDVVTSFDFETLCWIPEFDALSLMRLMAASERLGSADVVLLNASGLLNLVAWMRQLEGHLVPHANLPEAFGREGGPNVIAISQNACRSLRHEVLTTFDPRRILDVNDTWVLVQREARSLFPEERDRPLYFSREALRDGRLRAVYVSEKRPYWIECTYPKNSDPDSVFQHFEMVYSWVGRAARVIDDEITGLDERSIEFRVSFAEILGDGLEVPIAGSVDLRTLIRVKSANAVAHISVDKGFDTELRQPGNIAERTLVEGIVTGAAQLAQLSLSEDQHLAISSAICPSPDMRFLHYFEARIYRDFIPRTNLGNPVLVNDIDSAMFLFGLGWKIRSPEMGGHLEGVNECKEFLNSLVTVVLNELCVSLKSFNREELIKLLLHNHEVVECERARWRRTARANIAVHDDHASALATLVARESRFTAASMASRILMEAAINECPASGGNSAGHIDLTRLMAQALIAYHWGGYSDVIHWRGAEARLRITPLGDVHFDPQFFETVYEPFGRGGSERQIVHAAESYAELFSRDIGMSTVETGMDPQFLAAWKVEFGASIYELRLFWDLVEDHCRKKGNDSVVILPRCDIVRLMMAATERGLDESTSILKHFLLEPRLSWRTPEPGFSDKDWFPWRFRRRYAVVRAPFLQLALEENPYVAFAPGLVRQAFALTIGAYYRAEIPQYQVTSSAMRTWLGTRNHRHRLAFNTQVSERMATLGWKVRKEMTVPALIGSGLERNYGDVDVVAWRPDTGRVLLMECKDVQFHRAMGEVAEQLHDFRGELSSDGKPDLLKKHLDRVAKVKSCPSAVARSLRINVPVEIEGHIVFKNPVPMRYVADQLASKIRVSLFEELNRL